MQNQISTKIDVPSSIDAPVNKGDVIGKVILTINDDWHEFPLVAKESVQEVGLFNKITSFIKNLF